MASHGALIGAELAMVATAAVVVRMLAEERLVILAYPEYEALARRTKRLIPFVL